MSYRIGKGAESRIVKKLRGKGYVSFRIPASGGKTDYPLPDILAANDERILAIEAKREKKDKKYIEKDKIEKLKIFAKGFHNSIPMIIVNWDRKYEAFYIGDLEECEKSFAAVKGKGISLKEL